MNRIARLALAGLVMASLAVTPARAAEKIKVMLIGGQNNHNWAKSTPFMAGILTAGEGNPLSHVQLLARNLGIPNVGVDETLLPRLDALVGKQVLLAVSAAGSVPRVFGKQSFRKLQRRQTRGRSIIGKSSRRATLSAGSTRRALMFPALLRMKFRAWSTPFCVTSRRVALGIAR